MRWKGYMWRVAALFGITRRHGFEATPRPVDMVIAEMLGRGTAARISRDEALSVPAVQKGRNLICSIATLPLVQLNERNVRQTNPFLKQTDPDVPNVVTMAQTLEDLLFEGISWWMITATDFAGFPTSARHLDISSVSLDPPTGGKSQAPLPSGRDPRGAVVYVDGQEVSASRVIRFDSPNPAVLKVGARAIRRAVLLERASGMYAEDPRPLDYFSPAEGADELSDDEVDVVLADWQAARKKRSTAWVPAAMKYNTVDSPSPQQLQLVQLQRQAGLDIANSLGVDPEELGISTTSRTYANAVDRRRDRINDVLAPFMRAITDRLSMGDVTRRGHRVVFELSDYLKSNPTERWAVHEKEINLNVRTPDEIREEEGWPGPAPKPAPTPAPEPEPAPVVDDEPAPDEVEAAHGSHLTFDKSQREHTFAFPVDGPARKFAADSKRRTITGTALPYGAIAEKYGLKFRFRAGALEWSSVERVKHYKDHAIPVGKALELNDSTRELAAVMSVGRGPTGDELLMQAEDGTYDGFSVGVDFDWDRDVELMDDGVYEITRATLKEISSTAMPAFDDARHTKVVASRDGGKPMDPCTKCGQVHAVNAACPEPQTEPTSAGLALSDDQVKALLTRPGALEAIFAVKPEVKPATPSGAFTLTTEQLDALIKCGGLPVLLGVPQQISAAPVAEVEKPQPVDPTRRAGMTASVQEPLPYRFDAKGNLTRGVQYDFSTDLISGSRGDGEAMARAKSFLAAMEHVFTTGRFDVDKADAVALNPNRQRPDMYVDQKDFSYPMWEAINKGTLADSTPFVLPKFSSASGLVAAHVEGVEPTPGTFVATSQTITPSALSGKVEITREAWDQGGNPQLSGIIWRQMLRAWFEGLEASAVALLDSLTPTAIALSTAAQDDVLVDEIESAFAALQFVRGGFRMNDLFLQVDLFKALAAAKDADGRKLLPRLGPTNASGTVSDRFADLDIAGVRGRPGWALAASGTVSASSYLFDRNDVHGWASAPQRLEFEYRVAYVDVAIWGYKATANTDLTGVREITYDPA